MKAFALASLIALAHGATIQWTGIVHDQQWHTASNWLPSTVPGPSDDVVIKSSDGGNDATVVVTDEASVKSLSLAGGAANVRLQIKAGVVVQGATTVGATGTLELSSGDAALSCNDVTIAGALDFQAGTALGSYAISGKAGFNTAAAKVLTGAQFDITSPLNVELDGTIQFSGGAKVSAKSNVVATGDQFLLQRTDTKGPKASFVAPGLDWSA